MNGDIALAGFLLTAAEWEELDLVSRAQLVAAATRHDDAWVPCGDAGVIVMPRRREAHRG